jgi:predicted lipid-binding transport protein (Tim44 family)
MALLAGLVIFALVRLLMRRPAPDARPMHYAGLGRGPAAPPPIVQPHGFGGSSSLNAAPVAAPVASAANIPADFDVDGFLRQAKLNFMRLQSANDRGDTQALRDFTTDELFQALAGDITARGGQSQQTDISGLDAQLLEVTTEADTHWASVSFQGQVREETGAAPQPFHEIWHLRKPVRGEAGWLLAGIQQAS